MHCELSKLLLFEECSHIVIAWSPLWNSWVSFTSIYTSSSTYTTLFPMPIQARHRVRGPGSFPALRAQRVCELTGRQRLVCVKPRGRLHTMPMPPASAVPEPAHTARRHRIRSPNILTRSPYHPQVIMSPPRQADLSSGRASRLFEKVRACG